MTCIGTPSLYTINSTDTGTVAMGDARYTVKTGNYVGQRFFPVKRCISGITFVGYWYRTGDLLFEIRQDNYCSPAGYSGTIPLGTPGSSTGLVASTVIPASTFPATTTKQNYTLNFPTPITLPDVSHAYHLVFSSNSGGNVVTLCVKDIQLTNLNTSNTATLASCYNWKDMGDTMVCGVMEMDYSCLPVCNSFTIS